MRAIVDSKGDSREKATEEANFDAALLRGLLRELGQEDLLRRLRLARLCSATRKEGAGQAKRPARSYDLRERYDRQEAPLLPRVLR